VSNHVYAICRCLRHGAWLTLDKIMAELGKIHKQPCDSKTVSDVLNQQHFKRRTHQQPGGLVKMEYSLLRSVNSRSDDGGSLSVEEAPEESAETVVKAMRRWKPGTFLSVDAIAGKLHMQGFQFPRVEQMGEVARSAYVKKHLQKRGDLFLKRRFYGKTDYAVLADLPCEKCGKPGDTDDMVFCSHCSKGVHRDCRVDQHKELSHVKWYCSNDCSEEAQRKNDRPLKGTQCRDEDEEKGPSTKKRKSSAHKKVC